MKTLIFICFLSLCTLAVHSLAVEQAAADTEEIKLENRALVNINGSFYFVSSIKVNYDEALITCNDLGMKLVAIQSEEKQNNLAVFLDNNGYVDEEFWTSGVRYYGTEFIWAGTGETFAYTNWYPGQPNEVTSLADVAVAIWSSSRQWHDMSCDYPNNFICEEINKID